MLSDQQREASGQSQKWRAAFREAWLVVVWSSVTFARKEERKKETD